MKNFKKRKPNQVKTVKGLARICVGKVPGTKVVPDKKTVYSRKKGKSVEY